MEDRFELDLKEKGEVIINNISNNNEIIKQYLE